MSVRFFDTNVIAPLFIRNHPDRERARALFDGMTDRPHVTLNVLGEFFTTMTSGAGQPNRKPPFSHARALEVIEEIEPAFQVHEITKHHWAEVKRIKRQRVRNFPIWDALNWAVAKSNDCSELWTRDFPGVAATRDGRVVVEGVTFVDPFR